MSKSIVIASVEPESVQRTVLSLAAIGREPLLIPSTWEDQVVLVDTALAMGQRLTVVLAMIVARSKDGFMDPAEWVQSCTERWGWTKAHLHHLCSVGRLVIRECRNATLVSLDVEKLLSISRLPENLVSPFLEKARPQDHNRDEVRAAVNRWLKAAGEPGDEAPATAHTSRPQAHQTDFLEALFAVSTEDPHAFLKRVQERAATVDDALPVLNRALTVMDAMIGRLDRRHPEAFAVLAKTLRNEATRLEKMLADPATLTPARPLSPNSPTSSAQHQHADDAVRRRLPASAKQE